jgi:uncharacterized protein (TIGR03435 family)
MLAFKLNRPVLDETGVSGVFDLEMKWTPESSPPLTASGAAPDAPPDSLGPSLFTALQEQLGLKLEARKTPVQVLVIDSAERTPAEN